MSEPLVSVIIPTFNRPALLTRAVDSVLQQSYRNFEIIIVDDGSTDELALRTLEDLSNRSPKISILRNASRRGAAAARNRGIEHAGGTCIAFLDDDDEWIPYKLDRQVIYLKSNPGVGVVSCWYIRRVGRTQWYVKKPAVITREDLLWENFLGSFSFCMITREVIHAVGLLDEELPGSQDRDYWIRAAEQYKLGVVPEHLAIQNERSSGRITVDAAGKAAGLSRMLAKYAEDMSDDCRRHLMKYLYYYETLSAPDFKQKLGNFTLLRRCSTRNRDDRMRTAFVLATVLLPFISPWKVKNAFMRIMRRRKVTEEHRAEYLMLHPEASQPS